VQGLTTGPVMGRDVAFAPNGDQIALFVKKERGRNLMLINALTGSIERSVPMKIEQQLSPTYSPDGKKIAFAGFVGSQPDIFLYDLATGEVKNITNDRFFDGAPVFSPDGKWLVYSSVVNGYAKLFRLNLENPSERFQMTSGMWNDIDASFSPDGKRIVFSSYYKRRWQLFSATTDKPLHPAEKTTLPSAPLLAESRQVFQPPVEVAVDEDKIEKPRGFHLFVDDVEVNAGVSSDQLLVSRS